MIMIKEDYVSFEVEKLLKEKGFDEKCEYCYAEFSKDDIKVIALSPAKRAQSLKEDRYPYVTLQMAMKWLREVHGIFVSIEYSHICEQFKYTICLKDLSLRENGAHVDYIYNSYEAACEAAIKYCLENLI